VSAKPRVFVTQPIAESAMKRLRALGRVKVFPDDSRIIPQRTLIAAVKQADILFCLLHDTVDRAVIAANPKLRHVAAQSITPSNIDVAEATKRGIPVTVVPPVTTEATADLTFGLMIAAARRMVEGDRLVRAGKFPGGQSRHLLGSLVYGKTLGLIGGGGLIGKAVAKRAHGFSMRVLYWTPRRKPENEERAAGLTFVPLDDLLRQSDFVSVHSPLNGGTHHQIGAREFALMKKTAFIINTARGPIIAEAALVRALKARRIAGAEGAVMLRAERIFESEAIAEELAAYNPLIPDGTNLKATMMIEYPDVTERRAALAGGFDPHGLGAPPITESASFTTSGGIGSPSLLASSWLTTVLVVSSRWKGIFAGLSPFSTRAIIFPASTPPSWKSG